MYYLVAQKEIRSVAELKGKRVGVSQFGGTSDLSARLALKHFGVEPERDALIIQIGSEGTRMAALRAGSVAAIIVPVPAVVLLKRDGFNEISFVGDVVEFASNGYTTTDQRIKENPQEVKKVLRAMYRGLRFAKENPEGTIGVIQKEWKVDPEVAKESYAAIVKALNDDGIIGEKQLKIHFDIIRKTEKNIGEIPVEKVVDFRLLREVRRELQRKISSRNRTQRTITKSLVQFVDETGLVDGLEKTGVDELTHVFVFGSGKLSVRAPREKSAP